MKNDDGRISAPLRTLAPPPLPASQACRERAPSHMPRTVPRHEWTSVAAPSGCRNLQGAGRKLIPPRPTPNLPAAPTTRRAHDLCGPYGARSFCTCRRRRRRALHHGIRSSCDARLASDSRCTTGLVVPACGAAREATTRCMSLVRVRARKSREISFSFFSSENVTWRCVDIGARSGSGVTTLAGAGASFPHTDRILESCMW